MRKSNPFYALIATQTLCLIGSRMTSIGVGIWVFTETGKTAPLLSTSFFNHPDHNPASLFLKRSP